MKLVYLSCNEGFACLAGACPDTCCRDWEIALDEAALARYRTAPGALGEELRAQIADDDGPCFQLKGGFCPFLDRDGLCRIQRTWGAEALTHLLVTRHMVDAMPRRFGHLRSVAALRTGVLAQTGVETLELIRGAVSHIRPTVVIAVDALAARSRHRLCATVQLSDAGLTPGSGVGNHRKAVDAAALGVPVIALGVPTVIDGAALCGQEDDAPTGLFVTPRDIDSRVRELGRLIGRGLTLALQPGLSEEEVAALLG